MTRDNACVYTPLLGFLCDINSGLRIAIWFLRAHAGSPFS